VRVGNSNSRLEVGMNVYCYTLAGSKSIHIFRRFYNREGKKSSSRSRPYLILVKRRRGHHLELFSIFPIDGVGVEIYSKSSS